MPAKATSKKVPQKKSSSVPVVAETPHPQILPAVESAQYVDEKPVAEEPVESASEEVLEEMLEEDGDESALEQKNTMLFGLGALGTAGIIIATIIIFVLFLNSPKIKKEVAVREEIAPTASPTPSFVRSQVSFEVLNGSGVAGAAAKGAASLEDKGYTVVKTGNTKKQIVTEFFLSASLSDQARVALLADLKGLFDVSSSSGELKDSTATARLVIGSSK